MAAVGIDDALAKHIAHLFIRDPLVVFSERVDQDDETSMDHFENIQSTNWQTMRFKPPPVDSPIGWRVEFRSMEVQLTDFENAAYSVFIVLLTRAILSFNLNFYMPISKVCTHVHSTRSTALKMFALLRSTSTCNGHRSVTHPDPSCSTSGNGSSLSVDHPRTTTGVADRLRLRERVSAKMSERTEQPRMATSLALPPLGRRARTGTANEHRSTRSKR